MDAVQYLKSLESTPWGADSEPVPLHLPSGDRVPPFYCMAIRTEWEGASTMAHCFIFVLHDRFYCTPLCTIPFTTGIRHSLLSHSHTLLHSLVWCLCRTRSSAVMGSRLHISLQGLCVRSPGCPHDDNPCVTYVSMISCLWCRQ